MIIFPIVKVQKTFSETNQKTEFTLLIKLIDMAYTIKGDNRTLRTAVICGNGAPPTMHLSVEGINGASPRSVGRVVSGASIKIDKF